VFFPELIDVACPVEIRRGRSLFTIVCRKDFAGG
jgi:hypothetical protein